MDTDEQSYIFEAFPTQKYICQSLFLARTGSDECIYKLFDLVSLPLTVEVS